MDIDKEEFKADPLTATRTADEASAQIYIDPVVERKIISKFDWLVLPQFSIIILLAYLDRSNIGNARIFGFEESLNLSGNDFANISTFFYVTYVIFEIPWVLCLHKLGANTVLAIAIVLWSAITIGMGFVKNYHQCIALRFLLGFAEAGLFPALTYILSTMYTRASQGKRVAVLYGAIALSGAFGGLIAYGIQLMGDKAGLEAWRWLFIIEGIISFVLGIGSWFSIPTSAEKAWFLKDQEREVMRAIRERDALHRGSDKFSWEYVTMAFTDIMVWVAAVSLFCAGVPLFGFGIFLPTIIKGLGYASIQVNYLTIPVYVAGCIFLAGYTYLSDRLQKRAAVIIWVPLPVVIGYAIAIGTPNPGAGYFGMFLCSALYSYNTLLLAWVSNNLKPDAKRSAGLPLFISIGNASGMISSQVYPTSTGPRYIMGNAISLATEAAAAVGVVIIWFVLRRRNQQKAKLLAQGVSDNGLKGDKALDFEYIM